MEELQQLPQPEAEPQMEPQGQPQAPLRPVPFYQWAIETLRDIEQRQRELHRQRHLRTIVNGCYHFGAQRISMLPSGSIIVNAPQNDKEPVISHNLFRPYVRQVTASWLSSNAAFDILPITDNERDKRHARRALQRQAQHLERKWFTSKVNEKTAINAQLSAGYGFEVYEADTVDEAHVSEWKEHYEPVSIPDKTFLRCTDCGNYEAAAYPEQPQCAACGSTNVLRDVEPGFEGERKTSEGWEPVPDVVIKPVADGSIQYDLSVGREDTPWLYVFEDRPRTELAEKYGKLPEAKEQGNAGDEVMHPLRFLRNVSMTAPSGNGGGSGAATDLEHVVKLQRFWLLPQMYFNLSFDADTQMPDGTNVPAGTSFKEVFPDGLFITTLPGADRFLAVQNESHKDRFRWGFYAETLGRFDGSGVEDAKEGQREINLILSALVTGTLRTMLGSVAVDTRAFTDAHLFNRPSGVIPFKGTSVTDFKDIRNHFASIDAPPINQNAYALLDMLRAEMQAGIGDLNSSGADAPGVDNPTATAAKIALAKSATAQNLHLLAFNNCKKDTITLALTKVQRAIEGKRQVEGLDARGKVPTTHEITPEQMCYDFLMFLKPGSHAPNLEIEKQAKLLESAQTLIALQEAGVERGQALRLIEEAYSLDLDEQSVEEISEVGEETLELMFTALDQNASLGLPVTPEELYALAPVIPEALGHEQSLRFWQEWISSKDGRRAPVEIFEAARIYVQAEIAAIGQKAQVMAQLQLAGSPEMMMAGMQGQQEGAPPNKSGSKDQPKPKKQPSSSMGATAA